MAEVFILTQEVISGGEWVFPHWLEYNLGLPRIDQCEKNEYKGNEGRKKGWHPSPSSSEKAEGPSGKEEAY